MNPLMPDLEETAAKKSSNSKENQKTDVISVKWLTKMEERMEQRRNTIAGVCASKDLSQGLKEIIWHKKKRLWFMIVSDTYRLMYAYVSKVGSTNWKSAFLVLKGKYAKVEDVPGKKAHDPSLRKLSQYSPLEIEFRLRNYTKFLFVRHPFARVLSAYRSKLERKTGSFRKSYGKVIMERFHPEAMPKQIKSGSNVSFNDFVKYLSDRRTKRFDGHWQVISNIVFPCDIQYDYIGKLESSHDDSEYILKKAKVDHLIHFKTTSVDSLKSHESSVFKQYYQNISEIEREKLYKVYENDFQLFGYDRDDLQEY
ncbi:carbohydrate sulfotransferase 11-like isoform X2 [Anneissia japonica]|nr:carbohydrate sulfotransferase 11-like isoform X2 [Anneissia japonica]